MASEELSERRVRIPKVRVQTAIFIGFQQYLIFFSYASACLEPLAWQLMWNLVPIISLTNLARLLRAHDFTGTLEKVLHYLKECCSSPQDLFNALNETDNASSGSSEATDSSPATVGIPTKDEESSKKRKRDGTQVMKNKGRGISKTGIGVLFTSICNVLKQLQSLASDSSLGYFVEHLNMAMRALPAKASNIFGASLFIVGHCFERYTRRVNFNTGDFQTSHMNPWLKMWELRSINADNKTVDVRLMNS